MKKLLSILIIILLLSSILFISCGDSVTTTTETSVTTTVTDATTTLPNEGVFSSKINIKKDWEGKTLNIACSTWSAEPSAPWSVIELCVDYGKESGFGTQIDAAVLERQEFIKQTYGVELNWINATRFGMHDALKAAELAGNINYDLALPRQMRAQSIVANGSVYDLNDRQYIDFDNSYYSQASVEAYTAKGHTFFIDGDFSTLSKETAYVLYFNKTVLGGEEATANLYQKVREGKWTWSELVTLGSAAYKDNGRVGYSDDDTFGMFFGLTSLLYQYSGITQAGVDKGTGDWKITLNDDRVDDVVSTIITAQTSVWCCTGWGGLYPNTPFDLMKNEEILFYERNVDSSYQIADSDDIGVVPFPMLNEEQGRYCVPCENSTIVLMCIPKITQDRAMSEYFLDVLAWTGNEYTYKAYLEQKAEHFKANEDMEMLTDYIFPNIIYDAGAAVGWGSLIGDTLYDSYKENVNDFDNAYAEHEPEALETIKKWNTAWGAYTES